MMNWELLVEHTFIMLFPIAVVFVFVYLMLKAFFDQFEKQRKQELNMKFSKETLPVRLQAYERLILLLERISPESMVLRMDFQQINVQQFQLKLMRAVKDEFDHNLSQQIYVSEKAWAHMIAARQSMIQLISETAAAINPTAPAKELIDDLIDEFSDISNDPISTAKSFLHTEVQTLM